MSRFTIALFEDGLQLVPSTWLFDNKTMCYWPPYMKEKNIRKAIVDETIPDNISWTTHKVLRIFGTSNTYESGIEKVKLAQDYSDLDISDIDMLHQKRISRPKKSLKNYEDSSASDQSVNNQSDENKNMISKHKKVDKILSTPPPLPKSFVNKLTTEKKQIEKKQSEKTSPKENVIKKPPVMPTSPSKILPEIFRRLNQIYFILQTIEDRLRTLEENKNNAQKNKEMSVLQEFITLPLKNNEEMKNMEKDLENQDFFEEMAILLNKIGGRDSRELTINILKRAITNEIALQYSWAGKLKKMGFKDLLLAKCIMRAVRITHDAVTEKDLINYISKWLVQATLRHERSLEPKKTKSQKTEDVI